MPSNKNLACMAILLLMTFLYSQGSFAQGQLIEAINKELIPVKTISPNDDFADLAAFSSKITDKDVIALGEATHGTKEFFVYKHRLIKFLVTQMGFRTFMMESDYEGSKVMNDYITKGVGNAKDALWNMSVGVWMTEEFLDLIEWMKDFNSNKAGKDKIQFYGLDMQVGGHSGRAILDYLKKNNIQVSSDAVRGLELITHYTYERKLNKSELSGIKNAIQELYKIDALREGSIKQTIKVLNQTYEYIAAEDWYNRDILRDQYMAENCKQILANENKSKSIIWAHNLHIAKDITGKTNLFPMGHYLAESFNDKFYAIGFGFDHGNLLATQNMNYERYKIPGVSLKNSSDYIFNQASAPNFILDFASAKKNLMVDQFLGEKLHARSIGGSYDPKTDSSGKGTYQPLIKLYDAIIFFRETDAVSRIDWGKRASKN